MAIVDDEMKDDPFNSLFVDSLNSNLSGEILSPDDVAWVDSCFNKDVDASNTDWSSIKDALLEILTSQTEPLNSYAAESSGQSANDEILYSIKNTRSLESGKESDDDEDLIHDDIESIFEDKEGDLILGNKSRSGRGKTRVVNVFRPNYTEDITKEENMALGLDSSQTTFEDHHSLDDIFKVWDLGISDEQDDFTKLLDKYLDETPPQIQSATDDSTWKVTTHVSVDDLITGMGDLSLTQNRH